MLLLSDTSGKRLTELSKLYSTAAALVQGAPTAAAEVASADTHTEHNVHICYSQ
jgi:hypothetical protein